MRPLLIGIAGPSCSGKSTLARQLASEVLEAAVISSDDYWKDPTSFPRAGEWRNWELPQNLDFDRLYVNLRDLKEGKPTVAPRWVMAHKRAEDIVIEPRSTIIAEGFLLYHDPRVRELFDLKAYLDIDEDEIVRRRIARNRSGKPERQAYYRDVVVTEYRQYGLPAIRHAEMVLDGTRSAEENSFRIRDYLSRAF